MNLKMKQKIMNALPESVVYESIATSLPFIVIKDGEVLYEEGYEEIDMDAMYIFVGLNNENVDYSQVQNGYSEHDAEVEASKKHIESNLTTWARLARSGWSRNYHD